MFIFIRKRGRPVYFAFVYVGYCGSGMYLRYGVLYDRIYLLISKDYSNIVIVYYLLYLNSDNIVSAADPYVRLAISTWIPVCSINMSSVPCCISVMGSSCVL